MSRKSSSFAEMLEKMFEKPLFILTPTVYTAYSPDLARKIVRYCVKLYIYSYEYGTFETVIEECYKSPKKVEKEFEKATKVVKQRLGDLVCVDNIDGDCFSYFEKLFEGG
jgi:chemotaxis protein CheY-P-specific phosphatase CheC